MEAAIFESAPKAVISAELSTRSAGASGGWGSPLPLLPLLLLLLLLGALLLLPLPPALLPLRLWVMLDQAWSSPGKFWARDLSSSYTTNWMAPWETCRRSAGRSLKESACKLWASDLELLIHHQLEGAVGDLWGSRKS